jgi:hypothetical protein
MNFPEYHLYPTVKKSKIPSVIYSYWNTKTLPVSVLSCIRSWKKHNPTYKIHVFNSESIQHLPIVSFRHAKTQQQIADFLRLYLLSEYGGIWLDASVYLNQSLDWVHSYQVHTQCEYVGYKIKPDTNLIENWFMACVPKSTFISDWKHQFYHINDFDSISDYVHHLQEHTFLIYELGEYTNCVCDPHYLTMHLAGLSILSKKSYSLQLLDAEKGPFLYLSAMKWNLMYLPLVFLIHQGREAPVVKYRGGERSFLDQTMLSSLL